MNENQDVSFNLSGGLSDSLKHFNIDGTEATHVDVWVEALEDKSIWLGFLRNTEKFKFNLKGPDEALAPDGKLSTGCDRLFSLEAQGVIKLGEDSIFCLDSDDSFIKSFIPSYTSKKISRNHVYTTNIYAVENAFLHQDHIDPCLLANIYKGSLDAEVMPSEFILCISEIIYEAYIALNYIEGIGRSREFAVSRKIVHNSLDKLAAASLVNHKECSTFKNFENEISAISENSRKAIDAIGREGFETFKQALNNNGISESNIYLFVRGHTLFDTITKLYDNVSRKHKDLEIERLKSTYTDSSEKVAHVEKIWMSFPLLLKTKFTMSKVEVPYLKRSLDRLSTDYSL